MELFLVKIKKKKVEERPCCVQEMVNGERNPWQMLSSAHEPWNRETGQSYSLLHL
jgi:hypothetical protein